MALLIPINIYDIDNKNIDNITLTNKNCIYFFSYQKLSVKIISSTIENSLLYSVKKNVNNEIITDSGVEFSDNFGYTLYMPTEGNVTIEISNEQFTKQYEFNLVYDSEIKNSYYLDLLTNLGLPDFSTLENCLLEDFDSRLLLKRLLLDYQTILKNKGNIQSITKFFNLLGFKHDSLRLNAEFNDNNTKTGFFAMLFENYDTEGYDEYDLPVRKNLVRNIDEFTSKLINAIGVCNQYFTASEQKIKLFAIEYSSNSPMFNNIGSMNLHQIFEIDNMTIRNRISIDCQLYDDSNTYTDLIVNTKQLDSNLLRSESKYKKTIPLTINESESIFYVDSEIYDDIDYINNDLDNIFSVFGSIIHLQINAKNLWLEYTLVDDSDNNGLITFNKKFMDAELSVIVCLLKNSNFTLKIKVYDEFNVMDIWVYKFTTKTSIKKLDINVYSSGVVNQIDDVETFPISDIDMDINASQEISQYENINQFMAPISLVPNLLKDYINLIPNNLFKWISNPVRFIIEKFNNNIIIDELTDSLPLKLQDNYAQVLICPYDPNSTLRLRIFSPVNFEYIIIDPKDISIYYPELDLLYITLMDIVEGDDISVTKPYLFITSTENAVDFTADLYDFLLIDNVTGDIKSLYDAEGFYLTSIPVNFDYVLFEVKSAQYPDFPTYISKINTLVNSAYPRLGSDKHDELDLNDIVVCTINRDYVSRQSDIIWNVYNSFTKELILTVSEYSLKFRITERTCYDIECYFKIDNENYSIYKNSAISSFKE